MAETGDCSGLTNKLQDWFCALSKISAFDIASSKVNASSSSSRCLMNEEVIPVMKASRVNLLWNSWADIARQLQSFASDFSSREYSAIDSPGFCSLVSRRCLA